MRNATGQVEKIVAWLRAKIKEAGAEGLVVGVSGGIDSAVVSALIKKAFPENSVGLILPCYSDPQDRLDALEVINAVGLKHYEIDITESHKFILDQVEIKVETGNFNRQFADANLRARLRMSTLYTIANGLNYLVVGTDNAAEVYTGYFTKYGDGGVDILPLSEFTKGEVRELAKHLGIPEQVITKAPSAGLWEGQTDESEMGVTYDLIDAHLTGQAISEVALEKIMNLHKKTQHKREMPANYLRDDLL